MFRTTLVVAIVCLWGAMQPAAPAPAADPEPEAQRLQEAIADEHGRGAEAWIYNNLAAGMEAAKAQNKPLFVTFRCVPCAACKAFDAEVAGGSELVQQVAREKFVSVRQVEMKGVDLSLFQFDHDLNWAAMFINADGTVYARYGTQSAEGPDAYNSIAGLLKTMERVLELHENYPANKEALAAKRAKQKPYHTALDMPGMERQASLRELTTRENCIHCHMIHDAENRHAYETGTFSRDMLWRYPLPENIGLQIDPESGIRIARVEEGSPADEARLAAGEDVTHMNGQPMTSIADMQWVLHQLANAEAGVAVTGSRSGTRTLQLGPGWKQSDISWRGSLWSVQPKLRVWAPPAEDAERRKLRIPEGEGALEVRWINAGQPGGKAARDAGLKEGDVIVKVGGQPVDETPNRFSLHIKLNYEVGQSLPLTVLRDGKPVKLDVPLVE
jgi:serine protease Do